MNIPLKYWHVYLRIKKILDWKIYSTFELQFSVIFHLSLASTSAENIKKEILLGLFIVHLEAFLCFRDKHTSLLLQCLTYIYALIKLHRYKKSTIFSHSQTYVTTTELRSFFLFILISIFCKFVFSAHVRRLIFEHCGNNKKKYRFVSHLIILYFIFLYYRSIMSKKLRTSSSASQQ